jgi:hypothetical protein
VASSSGTARCADAGCRVHANSRGVAPKVQSQTSPLTFCRNVFRFLLPTRPSFGHRVCQRAVICSVATAALRRSHISHDQTAWRNAHRAAPTRRLILRAASQRNCSQFGITDSQGWRGEPPCFGQQAINRRSALEILVTIGMATDAFQFRSRSRNRWNHKRTPMQEFWNMRRSLDGHGVSTHS